MKAVKSVEWCCAFHAIITVDVSYYSCSSNAVIVVF